MEGVFGDPVFFVRHNVAYFLRYLGSSSRVIRRSAIERVSSSFARSNTRRRTTKVSYRIRVQFFSAAHHLKRAAKPFSSTLGCGSPTTPTFHKA